MTIASPHITHHNLQPVHFSPLVTPSSLLSSCPRSQAVRWLSSCISARSAISQMTTVFPSSPSGIYLVFLSIWTFIGFIFTQQLIAGSTDMAAVVRDPIELLISVLLMMVTPWSWPEAVHPSSAPHSMIMTTSYPFMPRSGHSITDNVSSCLNQRNTSLSFKRKRINHLSCGNFKWVNM